MRAGIFRNILALIGAFFVIIILLGFVLALVFGPGGAGSAEKVAVVRLDGVITDSSEITRQLSDIEERADIKAVVVRINSPGGAVGPSQEINSSIRRLRKSKKVVASMGAVAASGGLYAAVAADKVVASPGTITGSIGVIIEFINAEDLLAKIGLKGLVVKSGRFKDTGSPLREMREDEKALLQGVIDDVNSQFISAVAEGRHLPVEEVRKIADGRILTGAQALSRGLVDRLGDLTDSINLGAELAGIKGKPRVVYIEKKGLDLWKSFVGGTLGLDYTELLTGLRLMYIAQNPSR